MSYAEEVNAARRLAILLALYFAPEPLNRVTLRQQVELAGYTTSLDKLNVEIDWLAEMTAVEKLELDYVRLTARGEDIALGRSQATGVRKPSRDEVYK